ncbi:hypothetical protein BaRGS_00003557 [Batillaria attramentaria]|uniref:Uncharacterized protein n=1 Tax=Batillaria attramentaria TaxID=370345 RepID=A0ABD0M1H3_9CAEN
MLTQFTKAFRRDPSMQPQRAVLGNGTGIQSRSTGYVKWGTSHCYSAPAGTVTYCTPVLRQEMLYGRCFDRLHRRFSRMGD